VEADRQANDWIEEENRSKSRKMITQRVGGLSRGWISGGEEFRNWLLDSIEERVARSDRRYRSSAQGRDYGEYRAEELIRMAVDCFVVGNVHLTDSACRHPGRILLAAAISRQTSVGQRWIAQRLGMKSAANVSQHVRRNFEMAKTRIMRGELKKWEQVSRVVD
jgi:hypothetical protein